MWRMSKGRFPIKARRTIGGKCCGLRFFLAIMLSCGIARAVWSQQLPAPPPPPPQRFGPPKLDRAAVLDHLEKVRRQLENAKPNGPEIETLVKAAHRALDAASEKVRAKDYFGAEQRIAAADAFRRAAEHPGHVAEGPKGPVPQSHEIADHLQQVYFRLQQAEYFADSSGDADAKALPPVARRFYEDARKAFDAGNWFTADEYAKSADDTVHGLENLAQAAAPAPPPPPRRP
jgi:hypothetical protein